MPERGRRQAISPLVALGAPVERLEIDAFREFVQLAQAGEPAALVTVVGIEGSAPRGMGAAMTLRADGSAVGTVGGGALELAAIREAREALADGRPRRLHYDYSGGPGTNLGMACVGKTELYIQPCLPQPKLYVFGAGHIGIALAPIAETSGFQVTMLDDRPGRLDRTGWPDGVRLVDGPFLSSIAALTFDASTYVVIVTYEHLQDEAVLAACLLRPWRYLGMIGSRAKVARVFKSVGVDEKSRRRLADVHAPIGLNLGGRSPGEIAVEIAAELLAVRYDRPDAPHMRTLRKERAPLAKRKTPGGAKSGRR